VLIRRVFVWFDQTLKSNLESSSKLKEFIEEHFKQEVWLGDGHV
jgi:hypothetical protein